MKKDLVAYAKCSTSLYPEVSKKVLGLRSSLKDEPDECFEQVKKVVKDFAKADPEGTKKLEDCFHSNVNKDHLVKCH